MDTWQCVAVACVLSVGNALSLHAEPEQGPPVEISFSLPASIQLERAGDAWVVTCRGQSGALPAGAPDIPVFARRIDLEPGVSVTGQVVSAEWRVVTQGVHVAAVAIRKRIPYRSTGYGSVWVREEDPAIYGMDAFWPLPQVAIEEGWQGRRKLARVEFRPVQYHPVTGVIRVCDRMTVRLHRVESEDVEGPRGPLHPRRRVAGHAGGGPSE